MITLTGVHQTECDHRSMIADNAAFHLQHLIVTVANEAANLTNYRHQKPDSLDLLL